MTLLISSLSVTTFLFHFISLSLIVVYFLFNRIQLTFVLVFFFIVTWLFCACFRGNQDQTEFLFSVAHAFSITNFYFVPFSVTEMLLFRFDFLSFENGFKW